MRPMNRRGFFRTSAAISASCVFANSPPIELDRLLGSLNSRTELFSDVAQQVGIDFVHFNGMCGEHYYPEMIGSGAAMFDYDNDGDLDIFIVQGQVLGPGKKLADAMFPWRGPLPLRGRLYRNDSVTRRDGSRVIK